MDYIKKRVWFFISIVTLVVACIVFFINLKTSEEDFTRWMEKTYQIQCLDYNCDTFHLDATEGKEPVLMQSVHGGFSPGTFVMKVNQTYRNLNDPAYVLDIEVEGYLGEFTIKDETNKKIPKN